MKHHTISLYSCSWQLSLRIDLSLIVKNMTITLQLDGTYDTAKQVDPAQSQVYSGGQAKQQCQIKHLVSVNLKPSVLDKALWLWGSARGKQMEFSLKQINSEGNPSTVLQCTL